MMQIDIKTVKIHGWQLSHDAVAIVKLDMASKGINASKRRTLR